MKKKYRCDNTIDLEELLALNAEEMSDEELEATNKRMRELSNKMQLLINHLTVLNRTKH
jgi:hypothetical protein